MVLRKERRQWLPVAVITFVLFALPFLGAALAAAIAGEWTIAVVAGAIGGVPTALVAAQLGRSRIEVTPEAIAVRGAVGRRQAPRARATHLVRAPVWQGRAGVVDTVFVLDAGGRTLLRIRAQHYRPSDVDRLVAFLGLPSTGPDRPVSPSELDALYPGIVPWVEAHPARLAAYVAALTLVGVAALSLAVRILASP
ncbi:MAG TPA: hypothetical protein VIL48_10080 [Acidimicrobiales bacterium]